MIYTILVAHVADPLPPLASSARLADPGFTLAINDLWNSSYQCATRQLPNGASLLGVCLCMRDLILYQ